MKIFLMIILGGILGWSIASWLPDFLFPYNKTAGNIFEGLSLGVLLSIGIFGFLLRKIDKEKKEED